MMNAGGSKDDKAVERPADGVVETNDFSGEAPPLAMSSREKARAIRPWVDPEERIRVDFEDAVNVTAIVRACTEDTVELELETAVPHHRQRGTVPLRLVEVGEDRGRYTRNPEKPLRYGVLRLSIRQPRVAMVSDNP